MRHEKRRVKGQLQNVYILRPAHPYGRGEGEGDVEGPVHEGHDRYCQCDLLVSKKYSPFFR